MSLIHQNAKNTYGPLIRAFRMRSKQRMTQADLAEKLTARGIQMNRTAIARIESQKRRLCDFELLSILEELRIDMTGLIDRSLFLGNEDDTLAVHEMDRHLKL